MKRSEIPWAKIRKEYERGEGTTKQLAEKYGLSPFTVRNRCTKEKWTGGRNDVEQKFDAALEKHIEQKAMTVADRAAAFRERQIQEGEELLNMLIAEVKPLIDRRDVDAIKKFIDSWVRLMDNQREAHGLNAETPKPVFHVGLMIPDLVEIKLNPPPEPAASMQVIDIPGADSSAEGSEDENPS